MSREIKFRGQTRRKGEYLINMAGDKCEANWVYGGIFPQNNGGDFAIIYEQPSCEKRVVYADTVGQYIGVEDKNRKEVYEGDIVKIVDCLEEIYVVEWDEDIAGYVLVQNGATMYDFGDFYGDDMEVIGNVYENADLLKEAGNALIPKQDTDVKPDWCPLKEIPKKPIIRRLTAKAMWLVGMIVLMRF